MGEVDYVVEARRQPEDVLAVQGRDERRIEVLDDLVRELVAIMFQGANIADLTFHVREVPQQAIQGSGGFEAVAGVFAELCEEDGLSGHQRYAHRSSVGCAAHDRWGLFSAG